MPRTNPRSLAHQGQQHLKRIMYKPSKEGLSTFSFARSEKPKVKVNNEALGCLARGFMMVAPLAVDAGLWYLAGNVDPEFAGPALIFAPFAFLMATAAAMGDW